MYSSKAQPESSSLCLPLAPLTPLGAVPGPPTAAPLGPEVAVLAELAETWGVDTEEEGW